MLLLLLLLLLLVPRGCSARLLLSAPPSRRHGEDLPAAPGEEHDAAPAEHRLSVKPPDPPVLARTWLACTDMFPRASPPTKERPASARE